MLQHLLDLRAALDRGAIPGHAGICSYVAEAAGLPLRVVTDRFRDRWQSWPELHPLDDPSWPVGGSPYRTGTEPSDLKARWANPRRLSLLNHLIKEYSDETNL